MIYGLQCFDEETPGYLSILSSMAKTEGQRMRFEWNRYSGIAKFADATIWVVEKCLLRKSELAATSSCDRNDCTVR